VLPRNAPYRFDPTHGNSGPGGPPLRVQRPEHPPWCDRSRCTIREPAGTHRSTPATVELDGDGAPTISAHLSQGPGGAPPLVELHAAADPLPPLLLRPDDARTLARMLAWLARAAQR
jgi:hypothetical protein